MKAELIDHMGDDLTVVNAARVSFDKESVNPLLKIVRDEGGVITQRIPMLSTKDKGLINYLATHGHWTPFSHPQITMRYTVPIFVARQEFKHIVGFARNEVSRRYVDSKPEFYMPEVWRSRPEGSVKQGSGKDEVKETCNGHDVGQAYFEFVEDAEDFYNQLLDSGIAPEQARMVLPQSMYTSYYITGSLAAFARFVRQRLDPHAQVEIQELAKMVDALVKPLFPVSWAALVGADDE